jgi:hypothetical protein
MLACPECGTVLQTVDLPCPECALAVPADDDPSSLHEYSRTFRNRTAYRYRPSVLASEISTWLAKQDSLLGVSLIFHRDLQALTGGATATCQASMRLTGARFQVAYVALAGRIFGQGRVSPGDALNGWADHNPSAWRLNHWIFTRGGVPAELWVLYADGALPSSSVSAQELGDDRLF